MLMVQELKGGEKHMGEKIIFKGSQDAIDIYGYFVSERLVSLHYKEPKENLSGFYIVDKDGNMIFDASDFIYRFDVVDTKADEICYTNDPNYRQTEPWPNLDSIPEQAEPLSNEELTEAVADLMYEVSVTQLGL